MEEPFLTIRNKVIIIGRTLSSRKSLREQLLVPLYRNALYLIADRVEMAIIGFVFWIIAARFYTVETVGLASAIISATMLLTHFALLGMDYAIIRFLPNAGKDFNSMINSSFIITGLAALVLALLFIAGVGLWVPEILFLRENPALLCAFVLFTASATLYAFLERVFVAGRRAVFTLVQGTVLNVLRLILIVVFANLFAAFGIYGAWWISLTAAFTISVFLFLPRVQTGYRPRPEIRLKVLKNLIRFSLTNYLASLLWFVTIFALPLMVVNRLGVEENAYFYIAWQLANVLFAISISISFSLLAEGSHDEEKLGRNTRRSLVFTFAMVLPAVLLILLFGDRILSIFGSVYAENSVGLLRIAALSAIPVSFNQVYFSVKRVEMKMKSVIAVNAFTTVGTLVLSSILLRPMGITGAGVAWLSMHMVAALVVGAMWLRDIRERRTISAST